MWFLGIVIGGILGAAVLGGFRGGLAGALIGLIVALAMRSRSQIRQREAAARSAPSTSAALAAGLAPALDIGARLTRMEERLRLIEERLDGLAGTRATPLATTEILTSAPETGLSAADPVTVFEATPLPTVAATAAVAHPMASMSAAGSSRPYSAGARLNPVWAWFTGGNALTRIGVVVLFFGVGFLLRYFARYLTIPIELRLAGVAMAGAGLIGLGIKLGVRRPGYGLSLQSAGAGMLYLTTFAAFRFYEVLPAMVALALLALITVLAVWLALRNDSQPLAGLAIAGGFLAPMLVDAHIGGPVLLFGYFAVLNAAIFAVAWVRAWRALNVLGFLFTFVLGFLWGYRYYTPEFFATTEPFLVLFFAFYVAIAMLYAKRAPLTLRAPVDALLVFGVPLTGFALQSGLVRDLNHGVAFSALGLAAAYGVLFLVLRKRPESGLQLLARSFLALAIIFATVSIPFGVDAHWTSAWWALEAAGVYWIGCAQRQPLPRAFALVLQAGAAVAFLLAGLPDGSSMFFNASFFGAALIASAGLATSRIADRAGDRIGKAEHELSLWIFSWGVLWWIGGGALELHHHLSRGEEGNALVLFVTLSTAAALAAQGLARWPRLAWFGAALLPVMTLVAWKNWQHMHTTLLAWGWVIWPAAWIVHWWALRRADPGHLSDGEREPHNANGFLPHGHALSAVALVAWISWEASEWVGRYMPQGSVWMACAAAWPAIAYLGLTVRYASVLRWPLARYRDAYVVSAGTTIAALLAVWFAIVNIVSPGSPAPLPYVPVVNPLDVTLVATLACLWSWASEFGQINERTRYGWLGVAIFLFVNAVVFRAMHQWADVPWRWTAMLASRPLQAALTLTWTATALPLMVIACRKSIRPLWMAGAVLLAGVVGKLFLVDLAALSGLPRVIAFLGVGVLLLLIGYLAPLPPALASERGTSPR